MAAHKDPIVEAVRRSRDRHARRHKYDLKAIFEDMKAWERKHVKHTISLPPKRPLRHTGS